MTGSDIRTLKTYLRDCLEPELNEARRLKDSYQQREEKNALDAEIAAQLRRYYQGQSDALKRAIAAFKELFEEELKEGE